MQGEIRVIIFAFILDFIIFTVGFTIFLYLRTVRGDATNKGIPVLSSVRRRQKRRCWFCLCRLVPNTTWHTSAECPSYPNDLSQRPVVAEEANNLKTTSNVMFEREFELATLPVAGEDEARTPLESTSALQSKTASDDRTRCDSDHQHAIALWSCDKKRDISSETHAVESEKQCAVDSHSDGAAAMTSSPSSASGSQKSFREKCCSFAWFFALWCLVASENSTCQQNTLWLSILALCIMLPINLTCPMQSSKQGFLEWASAVNITWTNWRVWILLTATWIYSFITYYHVYLFHCIIHDPKLLADVRGFMPEDFTVMIHDIPRDWVSVKCIDEHFQKLFPASVVRATLVLDHTELYYAQMAFQASLKELQKALKLNGRLEREAEDLLALATIPDEKHSPERTTKRQHAQTRTSPPRGRIVTKQTLAVFHRRARKAKEVRQFDAFRKKKKRGSAVDGDIAYWVAEAAYKSALVEVLKDTPPTRSLGVGFVSFRNTACVERCIKDPRCAGTYYFWYITRAPSPQDILWHNMHLPRWQRAARGTAFFFLVFVASILLTSSAILTDALLPLAQSLEGALSEVNFLKLSLSGWGAPLMLFLINAILLPTLVQWAAHETKFWKLSQRESAVLHGNIIFLFLNTVIFPVLGSGSIGALLQMIYETDIQKWNISVGRLIFSSSGSFAIRYLLNGCLLSSIAQLLQLSQLIYFRVLRWLGSQGELWPFDFGYNYAFSLSMFFLTMSFGIAMPLVFPLACVFYTMKYLVDKYNFMFGLWKVDHETRGAVASNALRYMLGAVAFLQVLPATMLRRLFPYQFIMSGYFITYGIGGTTFSPSAAGSSSSSLPSDHASAAPSLQPLGLAASAGSAGRDAVVPQYTALRRGLVLSGTLLFLASLVTVVLLWGSHVFRLPSRFLRHSEADVAKVVRQAQAAYFLVSGRDNAEFKG